jgi:hypothetical protein
MVKNLKPVRIGYVRAKNVLGGRGNRQIKIGGAAYKRYADKKINTLNTSIKRRKARKKHKKHTVQLKARTQLKRGNIEGAKTLVKHGIKFSENDTERLLTILTPLVEEKYVVKMTLSDGFVRHYTLVNQNLNEFVDALQKNYFEENNNAGHGSDTVQDAIATGIVSIDFVKPEVEKDFKNKSGRFFRYLNKTDIDLTRYQIIQSELQKNLLEEHCLIYALRKVGVSKKKLDKIKSQFDPSAYFARRNLKKVSDILGKTICLYHLVNTSSRIIKKYFNKDVYKEIIELAIFEDHYFMYETTNYSTYFSNNYKVLKDVKDREHVYKGPKKNEKYPKCRKESTKCNSLRLIINLFNSGHFEKDSFIITYLPQYQKYNNKTIPLCGISDEQRKYKYSPKTEKKEKCIFFADTETDTSGEHSPLMIGVTKMKEKGEQFTREFIRNDHQCKKIRESNPQKHKKCKDGDCREFFYDFLKYVDNNSKGKDAIIYFHNLKYDYHVLLPYLYQTMSPVEKDNQYYSVKMAYNKRIFELRDSFKIINSSLSKFNKMFSLPDELNKKEAIAYTYYRRDNMHLREFSIRKYSEMLNSKEQQAIFKKSLDSNKKLFKVNGEGTLFDPVAYYQYYLKYDVLVLCAGVKKFKKTIDKITKNKINLFNYLSISSITNAFMASRGCFDNVYEMCGNLREYCSQAITGGRVQCLEKTKKTIINGKLADYDGVSLYPSSIKRLCNESGLPTGEAKRIDVFLKEKLDKFSYYIVTIKINKINKKQQLPFVSYKDNGGILRYTNDVPEDGLKCVVDSTTLTDWVKFQDIEYEIIDGVYWNNGFNNKMGEVIGELFDSRLKHKKAGNQSMQLILKLMMNAAYGKTIIKKSNSVKRLVEAKFYGTFINSYYYLIKKPIKKLNDSQYIAELDDVDESYNLCHVGVSILSMSKRIMNEVFDIANENEFPIYYTDTDSMHIKYDDVPKLEIKFKQKYGRELTGKQLGQFHIDFDLKGAADEIYATKSIFLGKKCYIDLLESKNKNGETITGMHYRMKGATVAGLEACSKKIGGMFNLYKKLLTEKVKIYLNPKGKFMCNYVNNRIVTRKTNSFSRELSF